MHGRRCQQRLISPSFIVIETTWHVDIASSAVHVARQEGVRLRWKTPSHIRKMLTLR